MKLLLNSLLVASLSTFLAMAAGMIVALWASVSRRGRLAILASAAGVLCIPPFLAANSWLEWSGKQGNEPWIATALFSMTGTVFLLALLFWPIAAFLFAASWSRMDAALAQALPELAGWKWFRWVAWPQRGLALRNSAVIIFVLAFNQFSIPALLQTKVLPSEMWVSFNTNFDFVAAFKTAWPMVVFPIVLLGLLRSRDVPLSWKFQPEAGEIWRTGMGRWRWLFRAGGLAIVGVSLGVPLKPLVLESITWTELVPAMKASFRALAFSILFAGGTAILCAIAGLLLARWKAAGAGWFFFMIPGVLTGISLLWLLTNLPTGGLRDTVIPVLFLLVLRYGVLAWAGVRSGLRQMDRPLLELLRQMGGRPVQTFRYALWPQIRWPTLAACYLIFLFSLWDVETILLVYPPGMETVAVRVFNLLHYGHTAQVNALSLVLLAVGLLPLLVLFFRKRWLPAACLLGAFPLFTGCNRLPQPDTRPIQSTLFASVQVIGSRGTGLGQFNKPRSLAIDEQDNLYVVDTSGRVQKFSSRGDFIQMWQMPQIEKGKPKGMARDEAGNIIVIEPHYSRFNHFTTNGVLVKQWGHAGTEPGNLSLPRSAAVTPQGEIYLTDYVGIDRVEVFSSLGERFLRSFGSSGSGPGQLSRPEGIALDGKGQVYVANSCNHRVEVFTTDGQFVRSFGGAGSGSGQMSFPYDVRLDSRGLEYVCEFGNSRIQVFDPAGKVVEIIGGPGSAPGEFNNPWEIAFDSHGNLYVADGGNHRVQKLIRRDRS